MDNDVQLFLKDVSHVYPISAQQTLNAVFQEVASAPFQWRRNKKNWFNVLSKCSLTLENGESLGIIGPTRSGKSTFCAIAGGVIHPSQGIRKLKGRVQYLRKPTASFRPTLSLKENMEFRAKMAGLINVEVEECINKCAESLKLTRADLARPSIDTSPRVLRNLALSLVVEIPAQFLVMDYPIKPQDANSPWFEKMTADTSKGKIICSNSINGLNGIVESSLLIHEGRLYGPFNLVEVQNHFDELPAIREVSKWHDAYWETKEFDPMNPPKTDISENSIGILINDDLFDEDRELDEENDTNAPPLSMIQTIVDGAIYSIRNQRLVRQPDDFLHIELIFSCGFEGDKCTGGKIAWHSPAGQILVEEEFKWSAVHAQKPGGKRRLTFKIQIPRTEENPVGLSFTPNYGSGAIYETNRIKILACGVLKPRPLTPAPQMNVQDVQFN